MMGCKGGSLWDVSGCHWTQCAWAETAVTPVELKLWQVKVEKNVKEEFVSYQLGKPTTCKKIALLT